MDSFFTLALIGPKLPSIAIAIAGLVCAWLWRAKHPMASALAAVSMVGTLLAAIGRVYLEFRLFNDAERFSSEQLPSVTIYFGGLAVLELTAFVVLLTAVFIDRPENVST
jgi:hypothetical protein